MAGLTNGRMAQLRKGLLTKLPKGIGENISIFSGKPVNVENKK